MSPLRLYRHGDEHSRELGQYYCGLCFRFFAAVHFDPNGCHSSEAHDDERSRGLLYFDRGNRTEDVYEIASPDVPLACPSLTARARLRMLGSTAK